jgi:hypothetical protein
MQEQIFYSYTEFQTNFENIDDSMGVNVILRDIKPIYHCLNTCHPLGTEK